MEQKTAGKFANNLKVLIPLLIICVVASALLGGFNQLTKDTISENSEKTALATRLAMIPEAAEFKNILDGSDENVLSCYEAVDAAGKTLGYVAVYTTTGYKPGVEVTVGMDAAYQLIGISVGGTDFNETAGLGAKAKEASFTDQFAGKSYPVATTGEDANRVDAITGATKTTNGVVNAVNNAVRYVQLLKGDAVTVDTSIPEGAVTYTASYKGFAGPVAVTVSFDQQGAINGIAIGDESFAETEGFGANALEPSFAAQFMGMTPPLALEEIDALAGATYTSTAVVDAINDDYRQFSGQTVSEPVEEEAPSVATLPEDSFTASSQGFAGPVAVTVTFDESGAITSLTIGDDSFNETPGLGKHALDVDFIQQFIGKAPELALSDIDAIAGATITTTAVVDAINQAYAQFAAPSSAEETLSDGAYTASSQGFAGPVAVTVTFDESGAITSLTIGDDSFNETPGLGKHALDADFIQQFIGKTPELALSDIDAIAGATITTTAVVDAINQAYAQFAK